MIWKQSEKHSGMRFPRIAAYCSHESYPIREGRVVGGFGAVLGHLAANLKN
jgi:hypothetical protein